MRIIEVISRGSSYLANLFTHLSGMSFYLISKFLSIIVLVRALGPAEFAIYTLLNISIYLVSSFGTMGMNKSCILYFSRKQHTNLLLALSLIQTALIGGLLCFITYIVITIFNNYFSQLSFTVKIITVATIPFYILGFLMDGMLIGEKQFFTLTLRNSLRWGINLILLVVFFFSHNLDLEVAMICNLITTIFGVIFFIRLVIKDHPPALEFNYNFFKESYLFGIKMYVIDIMVLLCLRYDYYWAKAYDTVVNVGYYALVTNINEIVLQLPRTAYDVIFPRGADSIDKMRDICGSTCRIIFTAMLLWYLVMIVAGKLFIKLIGGSQYLDSYSVLILQYIFVPFFCIYIIISGYISGINKPNILLISSMITLVIMVATNFILTPLWGIYGAALSKIITSILAIVTILLLSRKVTEWNLLDVTIINKNDIRRIIEVKNRFLRKDVDLKMSSSN